MASTKTLKCLYLCIQLLTGTYYLLSAQEYILQIDHYGIEEGLSHRDVLSAVQDRKGLMWFGTQYGLNRFDGYEFNWYTKETHGLHSNRITHISEDSNGRLWLFDTGAHFVYLQSIDIFDPATGTNQSFEEFFE